MLSQKSIRSKFFLQLASTITMLVVIFSGLSYQILKINIMQSEFEYLIKTAQSIIEVNKDSDFMIFKDYKIIKLDKKNKKPDFKIISDKEKKILILTYPYNNFGDYLIIKKDITQTIKILDTIFISLILIILIAISLIIFYSLFLSRVISISLKELGDKISRFDDNFKIQLDLNLYPTEFHEIIKSINHLIARIENYNNSQKELFIGIAHELKTPLAVMKAKNDVTLIKKRDEEYYKQTILNSNESIDNINKIINEILKIGRLEGAQFEESDELDIIDYIRRESRNFSLLGVKNRQTILLDLKPEKLILKIQKTLFLQILQNFIQNAFKFSPNNSEVKVITYIEEDIFVLIVEDSGCGIDESKDYFAPFKRFGNKEGVGLGLFLCKTAATAIKGKVYLENKKESSGTRAIFKTNIKVKRVRNGKTYSNN